MSQSRDAGILDLDSYPIRDTLSASDKEGQGRTGCDADTEE